MDYIYIYIIKIIIIIITLSASMSAPASIVNSPVSSSLTTDAVRPAAEEAFPDV
jgi:hypothetical protein